MTKANATFDIPSNPVARRIWINYQLQLRGLSCRELGRREGVTHQAISNSALGTGSSHLQEAIAKALDIAPENLFPEHYDAAGNRTGRTRAPNVNRVGQVRTNEPTTQCSSGNVQKGQVA